MSRSRTGRPAGAVAPVVQPALRVGARPLAPSVRSSAMLLLNEELARARMREREADAARERLVARVSAARRWRRRAEHATVAPARPPPRSSRPGGTERPSRAAALVRARRGTNGRPPARGGRSAMRLLCEAGCQRSTTRWAPPSRWRAPRRAVVTGG